MEDVIGFIPAQKIKLCPGRQEIKAALRKGQTVFTYFHFAADRDLTDAMINSGAAAVAYETLADDQGRLPLLTPMRTPP